MKNLFTKFAFIGFLCFGFLMQAQISFEGTDEFGRIENITFHPTIANKLYAITHGNHIVTSNDKGVNWEVLYSFQDNDLILQDMKYLDGDKLSFRSYNTYTPHGVFIFDIATQTIEKEFIVPVTPGTTFQEIKSFDIYEANTDIALVHQYYKIGFVDYAKVYYTIDGGINWFQVYYTATNDDVYPNNVAISPHDPGKLFIARAFRYGNVSGGLFISDNAGAGWTEHLPGISFDAITFHPTDPDDILLGTSLAIMAQVQNLYRSNDGGNTWGVVNVNWTDHPVHVGSSKSINKIVYNPSDYNNILILEGNEIAITNDNGATWNNYIYPMYDETEYMFGSHASFNPFQPNEVFINAGHYPMFSNDGGITLDFLKVPFCNVTMAGVFVGNEEHLYYSVLGGIIHKNLNTDVENIYNTVPLFDYGDNTNYFKDPLNEGRLFSHVSSFMNSTLSVSTDHGANFTTIHSTPYDSVWSIVPDPNDSNKIWVSYALSGVVVLDIQDLNNIQETYIDIPGFEEVYYIYINPNDSDEVIITLIEAIYRSNDGGQNWNLISNGINMGVNDYFNDIDVNPFNPSEMIASSSLGIYKSLDGGATWVLDYPINYVTKIKYSTETNGHIVASIYSDIDLTYARIVYSKDGGENWNQVPLEDIYYTGSYSMDFRFYADAVDVYIGSYDLGLLKYTIDLSTLSLPADPVVSNEQITVYPNPSTDKIFISSEQGEAVEAKLYSTLGEFILKSSSLSDGIDVSHLSNGVYLLSVKTSNNKYTVKTIIKK